MHGGLVEHTERRKIHTKGDYYVVMVGSETKTLFATLAITENKLPAE